MAMPHYRGEDESTMFRENQYFRQPWLVLLLAAVILLNLWALVQQVGTGVPWGDNPAPDAVLVAIFVTVGLGLPTLMLTAHLEVAVLPTGLRYQYFPFHLARRTIGWGEVAEHSVVEYRPLRDFGGWGIRYGPLGKAYSVSGTSGVLVVTRDGRRVLFGSRRAEELDAAMSSARSDARVAQ